MNQILPRPPAPEGVTFDTNIYVVASDGTEACIRLGEAPSYPIVESVEAAIGYALKAVAGMSLTDGATWRVMTRDEIADYRRRENEDASVDEDE